MNKIEQKANELEIPMLIKTEEEVVSVFERCRSVVSISPETLTGKRGHTGQLSWLTIVNFLRCKNKAMQNSSSNVNVDL